MLERKREGWKEVGKKVESCASLVKGVFVTGDGSKKGEFEDREPLSEDVPSVSRIVSCFSKTYLVRDVT